MADSHRIFAHWGARAETAAALATRFTRMMSIVSTIHPLLEEWDWIDGPTVAETGGAGGTVPWHKARTNLEAAVIRNMGREDGIPNPLCGYWLPVSTNQQSQECRVSIAVSAGRGELGGSTHFPFMNRAVLGSGAAPDTSLNCFQVWRRLVLTIAETWEATWVEASAPGLLPSPSGYPVRVAWMNYVSPHYAPLMTPPASAVVEHRPNGGLFLAATRDVFDIANPAHLAVAREIEAALQPMNDVPCPNDAPYL